MLCYLPGKHTHAHTHKHTTNRYTKERKKSKHIATKMSIIKSHRKTGRNEHRDYKAVSKNRKMALAMLFLSIITLNGKKIKRHIIHPDSAYEWVILVLRTNILW